MGTNCHRVEIFAEEYMSAMTLDYQLCTEWVCGKILIYCFCAFLNVLVQNEYSKISIKYFL